MYLMFTLYWLDHDQKYNNLIVCVCHDDSEYTYDLYVFVNFKKIFLLKSIIVFYQLYYIEILQPLSTS